MWRFTKNAQRSALAALVRLWPTSAWIAAGATSAKRWLLAYTRCSEHDAHRLERLAGLCHRHPLGPQRPPWPRPRGRRGTLADLRDHTDLDDLVLRGDGWNLTRAAAEQLFCDSSLTAVLFDGKGTLLDANDAAEQWSRKQRRAIAARDKHSVTRPAPVGSPARPRAAGSGSVGGDDRREHT